MDDRFQIVFFGELIGDTKAEDAARRLQSLFGVPQARARELLSGGERRVLKRDIDAIAAEQYRSALERAGLAVSVEPAEPLNPADMEANELGGPQQPERCPTCGSARMADGECLDCGMPRNATAGPRKVPAAHGLSWVARGFWHFRTGALAWVLITVIFVALSIAVGLIPFVAGVVVTILSPILAGGVMLGAHEQDQGRALRVEHLFAGFAANAGPLALIGLLYLAGTIVVAVVAAIMLATAMAPLMSATGSELARMQDAEALFELVGPWVLATVLVASLLFVPLIMAVLFAPALVVLDGLRPAEAMRLSFAGCLINVLPFLLYGLIALALAFLGALPFGLGLLVVWPTLMAAVYAAYRDIYHG